MLNRDEKKFLAAAGGVVLFVYALYLAIVLAFIGGLFLLFKAIFLS